MKTYGCRAGLSGLEQGRVGCCSSKASHGREGADDVDEAHRADQRIGMRVMGSIQQRVCRLFIDVSLHANPYHPAPLFASRQQPLDHLDGKVRVYLDHTGIEVNTKALLASLLQP
jgi:hypothetical protein